MRGASGVRVRTAFKFLSVLSLGVVFAAAFIKVSSVAAQSKNSDAELGAPEIPVKNKPKPTPTVCPTATPVPTPVPSPTPGKEPCVMYVTQRGPGNYSVYHVSNLYQPGKPEISGYSNVRYPSTVFLWIGGDITPDNWKNYFSWSGDFTVAGWRMNDAAMAKYGTKPDGRWIIDPCNRNYTQIPACKSNRGFPPPTVTKNGVTYQILGEPVKGDTRPTLGGECTVITGGQVSPLVVDLKGSGVQFTPPAQAVSFEIGGDSRMTHWISNGQDIAFLAVDTDANGIIDNGSELFGNTNPAEGNTSFSNGFEALAVHDDNGDGLIDAKDSIFAKLALWYDANANARTDSGELVAVSGSAIRSLDLRAREVLKFNDKAGNFAKQEASIALENGGSAFVYDVWFAYAADGRTIAPLQARSAPANVPAAGAANHDAAYSAYQSLLKSDNWSEAEFPFQKGKLRTIRDTDGNVAKLHASWKHAADSCSANVYFSPSWRVLSSRVDCTALGEG